MSKAKNTTSTSVDPWVPSDSTFQTFKDRAQGTILPEFTQALEGATGLVQGAANMPAYAPGTLETYARAQDPNLRSEAFGQVRQNVTNDVMQGINSTFGASGMTGSSLHQQNLARGLAEGIAGVENEAFQTGENRALQSAGLMDSAYNDSFGRQLGAGSALASLGSAQQTASQNALQSLMGSAIGGAAQSTTQSQSPGLMGVIGSGLGIASMFSDRRLKKDVKRVGAMDDGTPIYTYKYIDGSAPAQNLEGVTMMGVMAQEVKPEAVVQDDSGFMRVNYGVL